MQQKEHNVLKEKILVNYFLILVQQGKQVILMSI